MEEAFTNYGRGKLEYFDPPVFPVRRETTSQQSQLYLTEVLVGGTRAVVCTCVTSTRLKDTDAEDYVSPGMRSYKMVVIWRVIVIVI